MNTTGAHDLKEFSNAADIFEGVKQYSGIFVMN
jgi:hypothetical protein